jgi:hypothetical protein
MRAIVSAAIVFKHTVNQVGAPNIAPQKGPWPADIHAAYSISA